MEIVSAFYAPSTSTSNKGKEKADPKDVFSETSDTYGPEGDVEEDMMPRRRTLKGQSAAMARKHLKRDVERNLAEGSQKFLNAFGQVDKVR